MFKLNGERQRIKGENGVPATILLNGKEASIQEHIKEGDLINIEIAINGSSPHYRICDIIKSEKQVKLEEQTYDLPLVMVNNQYVAKDYAILSNDEITTLSINTLEELLSALHISMKNKLVTKNFEKVELDYVMQDGDVFLLDIISPTIDESRPSLERGLAEIRDLVVPPIKDTPIQEVNVKEIATQTSKIANEESLYIVVNNETVCLPKKSTEYIFAGVFDFIDFDLSKPQGTIQLIKNGVSGALTDVIKDGDILEIYWKR